MRLNLTGIKLGIVLRRIQRHVILLTLMMVLSCTFVYGFIEPRTAPGQFTFHTFYLFPLTRPIFLQMYSRVLRQTEGGSLPPSTDDFLASRLWDNVGSREWRGILSFYMAQGPARWGNACGRLGEPLTIQLVQHLLKDMSADPAAVQVNTLIFIEYLRRKGDLYKGAFDDSVCRWDTAQHRAIYDPVQIQQARRAFEAWFAGSSQWSELQQRNPLEGTSMRISGVP